jgi:hypothetical protein
MRPRPDPRARDAAYVADLTGEGASARRRLRHGDLARQPSAAGNSMSALLAGWRREIGAE